MNNKSKRSYQQHEKIEAPATLDDSIFYGLALDEEQRKFRDAIYDKDKIAIICNSKAGTGKTTVAVATANLLVQYGFYDGIVYIMFPSMEQRQGYLPGGIEEKSAPYMEPLRQALISIGLVPEDVIISSNNIQALKNGTAYIEFTVDTFLRGCNFENKVIIVDEMQNGFFDQMKKVLTRMHDSNKIILLGHTGQCDLQKHADKSGFSSYLKAFEDIKDDPRVAVCELKTNHRGWFSSFCDEVEF